MKKYSQAEKLAIAKSAFKDDPHADLLFVSDSGTVLTQSQYDARKDKDGCLTVTNPNADKAEESGENGDKVAELKASLKEAVEAKTEMENQLANMRTDLSNANAAFAELQSKCDALQEEIKKLKAKSKK